MPRCSAKHSPTSLLNIKNNKRKNAGVNPAFNFLLLFVRLEFKYIFDFALKDCADSRENVGVETRYLVVAVVV